MPSPDAPKCVSSTATPVNRLCGVAGNEDEWDAAFGNAGGKRIDRLTADIDVEERDRDSVDEKTGCSVAYVGKRANHLKVELDKHLFHQHADKGLVLDQEDTPAVDRL